MRKLIAITIVPGVERPWPVGSAALRGAPRARGPRGGPGGVSQQSALAFFAHESCGKCFPCRIGTQRLAGVAGPKDAAGWKQEVRDIGKSMAAVSACGLGIAAPGISDSLLTRFEPAVDAHLAKRHS